MITKRIGVNHTPETGIFHSRKVWGDLEPSRPNMGIPRASFVERWSRGLCLLFAMAALIYTLAETMASEGEVSAI